VGNMFLTRLSSSLHATCTKTYARADHDISHALAGIHTRSAAPIDAWSCHSRATSNPNCACQSVYALQVRPDRAAAHHDARGRA
jgi:hypothetical protein